MNVNGGKQYPPPSLQEPLEYPGNSGAGGGRSLNFQNSSC